jgi:hypothetical protein
MKALTLSVILILTGILSPVRAQVPFIGHFNIKDGPDSKFAAFLPSPAGGYVSVAYGGEAASRNLYIYGINSQGDTTLIRKYPSPGLTGNVNRFPIAAAMAPDGGLYILAVQAIPQIQANVVIRTGPAGDSLWSTTVSPVETWAGPPFYVIDTHPDGGCVIAGTSNGFPAASTVTRIDDSGEVMWVTRGFDDDYGYNSFYAIDVNNLGDVFVTGRLQNNISGSERAIAAKVSREGEVKWTKVFFSGTLALGDSIAGSGTSVVATPDGGCIFGGWASDPGQLGGRAFLHKLDSTGNTVWVKKYFRWEYPYQQARVLDITTQSTGNYLCLVHQYYGSSSATPTIMKINPDGDSLWTQSGAGRRWRMSGTDGNDNILLYGNEPHPDAGWWEHSLAVRTTSGGVFSPPQCFIPSNGTTGIKLNPTMQWTTVHRGTFRLKIATDSLFSNLVTDRSDIAGTTFDAANLASNTTYYWKVQVFGAEGDGSPWSSPARFTTGDFTGIDGQALAGNDLKAYPNPASLKATLAFSLAEAKTVTISITNVLGQKVLDVNQGLLPPGDHIYDLNISDWAEGIYFCRLSAGQSHLFTKFMVTR